MELKDLIVTPLVALILYLMAYWIRPFVTNQFTKKYFIPSLSLKFIGAIALGLVYQFYYGGGDTFGYTTYGSSYIWQAFQSDPTVAFKLIFSDNVLRPDTFQYAQHMWYFGDPPTYFVVRVAGIFSLITFDTYSSIALLFAVIGFSGMWAMYIKLEEIYPTLHFKLALALFAVPSVIFWGSGIMKDTITLSAVGWASYAVFNIFFHRRKIKVGIGILFITIWVISIIKIYILFCLIPAGLVMIFMIYVKKLNSKFLRIVLKPLVLCIALLISYYGVLTLSQGNAKYSLDNILKTAEITAKDNSMWTVRAEGSGYSLGDYDFSSTGLLRKFIPSVWVTLYRPYIWESNNIVMLMSALESLILLILTLYIFIESGLIKFFTNLSKEPLLGMFLVFTVSFAFAVGVSSGNFGSLVRYKIPLMPFFVSALFILNFYSKKNNVIG
jgi:hypothetical protein